MSMPRKFIAALSGTYNVHANELAQSEGGGSVIGEVESNGTTGQRNTFGAGFTSNLTALINTRSIRATPVQETIKCVVHFLDDTEHIFEVDRTAKGEELMELVFRHLELIEREYFALQFTEMFHHPRSYSTAYNKWLDPSKKIRKQMRFCSSPYLLHFRVKFYVNEMSRLLEEYTRYHFYLQLRKDILAGRLAGDDSVMATLASYVLQSELGDYCEEEHKANYSNHFRFIPNQTNEFEAKVESLHRLHQGQTPADAELNYLEEAKHLDLYGIDLHQAKDCEQQPIMIGVSSNGLAIYKNQIKVNTFSWAKIVKISFKRRLFFIQLKHEGLERFDTMVGFNLCSYRACKSLWKSCVEQHTFFRLHTPKPLTKKFFFFFSLGSKFRYSGKTEFQTIEENRRRLRRTERIFIRNNKRNATMPSMSSKNDVQKHIVNLRLTTQPINGVNGTKQQNPSSSTSNIPPSLLAINVNNRSKSASALHLGRKVATVVQSSQTVTTMATSAATIPITAKHNLSQLKSSPSSSSSSFNSSSSLSSSVSIKDLKQSADGGVTLTNGGGGHHQNQFSICSSSNIVKPFSPSTVISLPFIDQSSTATTVTVMNSTSTDSITDSDAAPKSAKDSPIREWVKQLYEEAAAINVQPPSANQSPLHLITIKMQPDTDGRFGFNVKGGRDQNCPVLVSRVASNTPADNAFPTKLREGDQVILINGIDVSGHTHEQVVQLIRSTKNLGPNAELVLSIRPTVPHHHEDDDSIEEPPFQYTPAEEGKNLDGLDSSGERAKSSEPLVSPLDISMNLLQEGLESDSLFIQFQGLSRRNDNEPMTIAHLPENFNKNRYIDISPYDSTRVVLKESESGEDYINASYVTMNIEITNVTVRYIATQGPLNRTTLDFWQMAWENRCTLIVMVTPLIENGKRKCFKYWPDEDDVMAINDHVNLVLESYNDEAAFVERRFKLTDTETEETLVITQLQYLLWPDQGVPDDDVDFLKLIFRLRELRELNPEVPVIVHCSAGIGRTGVIILMETGMCLIEANQPIYPVELLREMRNQRAMLIQTASQFYFVCQALYHVYHDKIVNPIIL